MQGPSLQLLFCFQSRNLTACNLQRATKLIRLHSFQETPWRLVLIFVCILFNYPAITDYILNSPQALGSDFKFTTTAHWAQRCSTVRFPSPIQDIYLNSNLRVLHPQQTEVWIWINKVSAVNIGRTQQVIGLAVGISFSLESSLSPFYSILLLTWITHWNPHKVH